MKNIENTKLKKQEQFLENAKLVLSLFLKDVLKNSYQKQEWPKNSNLWDTCCKTREKWQNSNLPLYYRLKT